MATRRRPPDAAGPWLDPAQLEAWKALMLMLARLPAALEAQLRCDSRLGLIEYYVLASLSDQPGHRMRMSSLALITNAELSRLSHLVSRLERRGLVRREPDPTDGRYTNAVLTAAGVAHLTEAAPGHVARVRELVIDALDEPGLRALQAAAQSIVARIDRAE